MKKLVLLLIPALLLGACNSTSKTKSFDELKIEEEFDAGEALNYNETYEFGVKALDNLKNIVEIDSRYEEFEEFSIGDSYTYTSEGKNIFYLNSLSFEKTYKNVNNYKGVNTVYSGQYNYDSWLIKVDNMESYLSYSKDSRYEDPTYNVQSFTGGQEEFVNTRVNRVLEKLHFSVEGSIFTKKGDIYYAFNSYYDEDVYTHTYGLETREAKYLYRYQTILRLNKDGQILDGTYVSEYYSNYSDFEDIYYDEMRLFYSEKDFMTVKYGEVTERNVDGLNAHYLERDMLVDFYFEWDYISQIPTISDYSSTSFVKGKLPKNSYFYGARESGRITGRWWTKAGDTFLNPVNIKVLYTSNGQFKITNYILNLSGDFQLAYDDSFESGKTSDGQTAYRYTSSTSKYLYLNVYFEFNEWHNFYITSSGHSLDS